MPFPLIAVAAVAGAAGLGAAGYGAKKMYDANETMDSAKRKYENAKELVEKENQSTIELMDSIGTFELEIIKSFESFADTFNKIHNRPEFKDIQKEELKIHAFTPDELKEAYVGAAVLLGGLGGAGLGAAAGFAASGATTAAVMAFGAASTGTAISSLSGAAATNAVLAWLGGGALYAGGGGMALGSAVLGGATLGVGLLVGGAIFAFTGSKMSDKADEAWWEAHRVEEAAHKIQERMSEIRSTGNEFKSALERLNGFYQDYLNRLIIIVDGEGKRDYAYFTHDEKRITEITVNLVGLLYHACKVKLTRESEENAEEKVANTEDVRNEIAKTEQGVAALGL